MRTVNDQQRWDETLNQMDRLVRGMRESGYTADQIRLSLMGHCNDRAAVEAALLEPNRRIVEPRAQTTSHTKPQFCSEL